MLRGKELGVWLKVEVRVHLCVSPSNIFIKLAQFTAGSKFASGEVLGSGCVYCKSACVRVCVCACACVMASVLHKSSHTSVEEGSSETQGSGFFIVRCVFGHTPFFYHNSSYCRRCIRWMISRQSLKTRRIFSVSTAQVKWG